MTEKNGILHLPLWSAVCLLLLLLAEWGTPLLISLGASVLHELGHLGAMRARGVPVKRVVLYPFGPIIEPAPHLTSYLDDCLIYSAGIGCNLLTALLLYGASALTAPDAQARVYLSLGIEASLALALLNALPHPALDGGCALSALLLRRLSPSAAGRITGTLGDLTVLGLSIFVLYGLFYGLSGMSGGFILMYLTAKLLSEHGEA